MKQDIISFQQLYKQYSGDVFRFAYWLSGNAGDANDITAETFARVWMAETDLRIESVKAYLFAIARNLWLHEKRRTKKLIDLDESFFDPSNSPDVAVEQRYDLEVVRQALQSLPEIDRTIFILRFDEQLSHDEIAQATGLTVGNVKVRLFRARKKLSTLTSLNPGASL
ncbi:MAG TPA: sigma-70 family RNA polymerase sigma factor [Bacteroidota bacterium]|nr:sigma-70 family RNA polymerase sigma factor [Bacteroidota bacterium]